MPASRTVEMHHIRYFLAVSETLNWTKAAERCNVAQPALTRAIKALETELGGDLFRRERALSHLTELGQRMLPMLRQCYDAALAAKKIAASIKTGGAAPLSIAVSSTVPLGPFIPMLRELSRTLPGLQMKLRRGSASEVAEHLRTGAAELAIAGPLGETWSRLDMLPLFQEPFGLAVGPAHRLAGKDGIDFQDIASETLLVNIGGERVEELTACLRANGLADTPRHQVVTQDDLLALLKADMGVAIVPVGTIEANGLRRKWLRKLHLVREVSVYTVTGRQRALASATLFNMLRAADWSADPAKKP